MSMLDLLADERTWADFLRYKTGLTCPRDAEQSLRDFVSRRGWRPVVERIRRGEPFPLPRKTVLSKMGSAKKRTVYTYPKDENTVLKLLTHLLLRRYDGLFSDGLYSFRPGRNAKDAVRRLTRLDLSRWRYYYKVDIHNYFNAVPVAAFLPMLEQALADDPALFAFLRGLLKEPCVLENGRPVAERKGIMAGTPQSAFYANLDLRGLDAAFAARGVPYARYSDDILVFAEGPAESAENRAFLLDWLARSGLEVNPAKEAAGACADGWTFLGFSFRGGTVDIAPATVQKLKDKMRRKTRALRRWQQRNCVEGERAATAFLRVFNRKLLESPMDNELTWSYWFFSVINTADSLHEIDRYCQDCVRYLVSGTRTKARFRVRYDALKRLGYRSLVHAYYDFEKNPEPAGQSPAEEAAPHA